MEKAQRPPDVRRIYCGNVEIIASFSIADADSPSFRHEMEVVVEVRVVALDRPHPKARSVGASPDKIHARAFNAHVHDFFVFLAGLEQNWIRPVTTGAGAAVVVVTALIRVA